MSFRFFLSLAAISFGGAEPFRQFGAGPLNEHLYKMF